MKSISQGARAVANGKDVEGIIERYLNLTGYTYIRQCKTLESMKARGLHLFPEAGYYAYKCDVPLVTAPHIGQDRKAEVDFVIHSAQGEYVLLSCKSQHKDGSAEQKLEYELRQLIDTQLPAAMLVYGPIKKEDGATGWTRRVLEEIWARVRYETSDSIFLFRTPEKLAPWIQDGMPVAGRGVRRSDIFARYCNPKP